MPTITACPYPLQRDAILAFTRKHHYSKRCPAVWGNAYLILNAKGNIQAAAIYGPPPYPSVAKAFTYPDHAPKLAWQARMIGKGISSGELDDLIQYANCDLLARGFWWVYTMTDPTAKLIDTWFNKRAYTGEVYHRNGFLYLGATKATQKREGWLVDGKLLHIRQGAVTLSASNIRDYYPNAISIREIKGGAKHRWAAILAHNERERAARALLMRYHPQEWQSVTQPRLLITNPLRLETEIA